MVLGVSVGGVAAHGVAEIGADAGRDISLVALVVGLVLEEDEFIGFVVGAVVGQVAHPDQ